MQGYPLPCRVRSTVRVEFDGIISSDDFSVYNGYPAGSTEMFGTSAASLQKSGQVGSWQQPALGQEFLDLIDEALLNIGGEKPRMRAYQNWTVGFKSRITRASSNGLVEPDTRRVSYYDRYGIKPNSGGTSSTIQRCHRTTTRQSAPCV